MSPLAIWVKDMTVLSFFFGMLEDLGVVQNPDSMLLPFGAVKQDNSHGGLNLRMLFSMKAIGFLEVRFDRWAQGSIETPAQNVIHRVRGT